MPSTKVYTYADGQPNILSKSNRDSSTRARCFTNLVAIEASHIAFLAVLAQVCPAEREKSEMDGER
jgi:hypothetical protein